MLESQKYSNIYKNSFTLKDKILLNDKFRIWRITAEIIKIYSSSGCKIKLCDDYKDILKKGEEFYTNITLIKKVNDTVRKKINQKNHDKLMKHLESVYGKNLDKEEIEYNYSSGDNRNVSDSNLDVVRMRNLY